MRKFVVVNDCSCQHYLHEVANYPRPGLKEKRLKEGDVVNFVEKWTNLYGTYLKVEKEGVEYDILPEDLKEIKGWN